MRIGVPKETKTLEGRVALVPAAAGDLVKRGHEVWLEKDAGVKSGFTDEQYTQLGVKIAADAAQLYEKGQLIVKVKEPIAGDLKHLRKDHLLFCYLHLAAEPARSRSRSARTCCTSPKAARASCSAACRRPSVARSSCSVPARPAAPRRRWPRPVARMWSCSKCARTAWTR
jgi:hypothetical protein